MNVILISIDSLRSDAVSCYGSDWVRTPVIDALAAEGILYENCIVQTPHTIPSHASMLTGLYPFNHGLRKDTGLRLSPGASTIFDLLKAEGYRTAAFQGNYVLGSEHGYSDWNRKGPPRIGAIDAAFADFQSSEFFVFIHTYELHVPYCSILPPTSRRDEVINSLLMHERLTGRRLPASVRQRHIPSGGSEWLRRIDAVVDVLTGGDQEGVEAVRRGYAQAVEQIDAWFGRLVSILKRRGIWDDTLVVVTADHGDSFNEHGEMNENPHWSSVHGAYLYDDVLRVPLIVKLPGEARGPRRISALVESVDIVPTICEVLGIEAGRQSGKKHAPDGVSLLKAAAGSPRAYAYSETLIREHHKVCLRSAREKLIVDVARGSRQVYDLEADREERNDLSLENPELAGRMECELREFVAARLKEYAEFSMTPGETAVVAERLRGLGYVD